MVTIHGLHDKLVKGELSAVELTKAYIARKDAVEPQVQAFLSDNREFALEAAAAVDKKIAAGEAIADLAGVPGAIKDNICIKGQYATCASKMLKNFKSPYNATVIEKLMDVDYVSLGKTNMDEFAMGSSTETRPSRLRITLGGWIMFPAARRAVRLLPSLPANAYGLSALIRADRSASLRLTAVSSASNRRTASFPATASSPLRRLSTRSASLRTT